MAPVLQAAHLSKQYHIGRLQQRNATFRDMLVHVLWTRWQRRRTPASNGAAPAEAFWALRDVSFDIQPGEIVGIIGRNGAGKSTLLKVLSRITEPTSGSARVRGRLGSLLEIGCGFHPELTGRENIFLNGAILGMRRREIQTQFDAIVAFAEVEQFLDTQVKHYSSGMYVRLAFAVAAHLDTELLVVDEVLAVGDAVFQKKCLGKMEAAGKEGRTVLLVSHNHAALRSLCTRGILLDQGRLLADGPIEDVLQTYTRGLHASSSVEERGLRDRLNRTTGSVQIARVSIQDQAGRERTSFQTGETIRLDLTLRATEAVAGAALAVYLRSALAPDKFASWHGVLTTRHLDPSQETTATLELPQVPLCPGDYTLQLALWSRDFGKACDVLDDNVDLPWITITATGSLLSGNEGFFRLSGRVLSEPTPGMLDALPERRSA